MYSFPELDTLEGADLSGMDLHNANFNGVNLSRADLSNADLWGATFDDAILEMADLSSADVHGVDFSTADTSCMLTSGAYINNSSLDNRSHCC